MGGLKKCLRFYKCCPNSTLKCWLVLPSTCIAVHRSRRIRTHKQAILDSVDSHERLKKPDVLIGWSGNIFGLKTGFSFSAKSFRRGWWWWWFQTGPFWRICIGHVVSMLHKSVQQFVAQKNKRLFALKSSLLVCLAAHKFGLDLDSKVWYRNGRSVKIAIYSQWKDYVWS